MTKQALLVMDVQNMVVSGYPDPDYLPRLRGAIDAARSASVPIIYVVVGFRPNFAEINTRNKIFGRLPSIPGLDPTGPGSDIHPTVAPAPTDTVVTKRRVGGFAGSDLDMVLRAGQIDRLVLTGIATSGCVLSTVRHAADLDYELTVLSDGCLDNDPEVHNVLVDKVFPAQADVSTISEWTATL